MDDDDDDDDDDDCEEADSVDCGCDGFDEERRQREGLLTAAEALIRGRDEWRGRTIVLLEEVVEGAGIIDFVLLSAGLLVTAAERTPSHRRHHEP